MQRRKKFHQHKCKEEKVFPADVNTQKSDEEKKEGKERKKSTRQERVSCKRKCKISLLSNHTHKTVTKP